MRGREHVQSVPADVILQVMKSYAKIEMFLHVSLKEQVPCKADTHMIWKLAFHACYLKLLGKGVNACITPPPCSQLSDQIPDPQIEGKLIHL